MKLKDFAEQRNVSTSALHMYISRHKDEFEGHVDRSGKNVELDEVAQELLNNKYPPPKPVQIVVDSEMREENYELLKENNRLLKAVHTLEAELQNNQKLIEEAQQIKNQIALLDDELAQKKGEIQETMSKIESLEDELKNVSDRADEEKKRADQADQKAQNAEAKLAGIAKAGFWERRRLIKELKRSP